MKKMKPWKVAVACIAILIVSSVIVYEVFNSSLFTTANTANDSKDKATIKDVFTNATQHAVFVDVFVSKSGVKGITTFDYATITDSSAKPLWGDNIDVSVPEGQSATITIPCNLSSGNYTVILSNA